MRCASTRWQALVGDIGKTATVQEMASWKEPELLSRLHAAIKAREDKL